MPLLMAPSVFAGPPAVASTIAIFVNSRAGTRN
jgi:hypothetical protein